MSKKVLFIDRDGTIIVEPPVTFQIDSLEQLTFLPNVISALKTISNNSDYELVMVTNQDGLGTVLIDDVFLRIAQLCQLNQLVAAGTAHRFSDVARLHLRQHADVLRRN